jgi:hypothetical protein
MEQSSFYEQLYASLSTDDGDATTECCLITDEPLVDKYVELNCGHKFNYVPLYNDILNHKQKFNSMESSLSALKTNEIRCPYCRDKQTELLPYYPEFGLTKVNGVNALFKEKRCAYQIPNPNYLENEPIDGLLNFKYMSCRQFGMTDDDSEFHCCKHARLLEKEHRAKVREQIALERKKMVEEKKMKAEQKKKENILEQGQTIVLCEEVIKSGPRKGIQCGRDKNRCKLHNKTI